MAVCPFLVDLSLPPVEFSLPIALPLRQATFTRSLLMGNKARRAEETSYAPPSIATPVGCGMQGNYARRNL